jgi:4-hydroxy-tetrahydrodipicolinate reductase
MNIALIGYGKMGKAIEEIASSKNHTIVARIGANNWDDLINLDSGKVDVAIEFSQPEAAYDNIIKCLELGIPTISGTTGWLDKKMQVEQYCKDKNSTFLYASNFSIGVNIFFKINELVSQIMDKFPEYTAQMEEVHHIHKKDSPSGTAITLAEGVASNHHAINSWIETDNTSKIEKGQLPIKSLREGEVPGTHTIQYSSDVDSISIEHKAHTRDGFALGAILVAEWITDKKGLLSMKDFMDQRSQ